MKESGWLKRQFDEARTDVRSWPEWMQQAELTAAASVEGSPEPNETTKSALKQTESEPEQEGK